jgi:bifunctional DNase/RNase
LTDESTQDGEMIEVSVKGLARDVTTESPVVILGRSDSDKILPIWIGPYEAWAIAMEMSSIPSRRPLTHDLMKSMLEHLQATVEKIEIYDLRDQTFYARILLMHDSETIEIDARPSDSIALALRTKSPIFANSKLFHLKPTDDSEEKKYDPQELKDRLKRINPEDFGKYSL